MLQLFWSGVPTNVVDQPYQVRLYLKDIEECEIVWGLD